MTNAAKNNGVEPKPVTSSTASAARISDTNHAAAPMATSASNRKKDHPMLQFLAGGMAGLTESSICHPLDTIKTRMQLRRLRSNTKADQVVVQIRHSLVEPAMDRIRHSLQDPNRRAPSTFQGQVWTPMKDGTMASGNAAAAIQGAPTYTKATVISTSSSSPSASARAVAGRSVIASQPRGPLATARQIVQNEGFFALYKGLSAVYAGAVLKFAIRFVSFEQYRAQLHAMQQQQKQQLASGQNSGLSVAGMLRIGSWSSTTINLLAGMSSGLTEAVMVVTPVEVCKIRMQAQRHSLMDATAVPKYRNVLQTAQTILREEGPSALYKGVIPTMLRQGINQAANFTSYHAAKQFVLDHYATSKDAQGNAQLQHWQSLALGGLSGAVGPMCNNPLDVVKTRLQKQVVIPGHTPKYTGLIQGCLLIGKEEGAFALWKGITPRLMRIVPGQAITFMTYEAVSKQLRGYFQTGLA